MIYLQTALSFLIFYAIVEFIKRKWKIPTEITRKMIHIGSGIGVLYWTLFLSRFDFLMLCGLFVLFFLIVRMKKWMQSLHHVSWKTYGELTYVIGLILLALFFYEERSIFQLGVLLVMIPDAFAGLTYFIAPENYKKILHIFVYFVLSLIILVFFIPFPQAFLVSVILSLTESASPHGSDNMTVPLSFILCQKVIF